MGLLGRYLESSYTFMTSSKSSSSFSWLGALAAAAPPLSDTGAIGFLWEELNFLALRLMLLRRPCDLEGVSVASAFFSEESRRMVLSGSSLSVPASLGPAFSLPQPALFSAMYFHFCGERVQVSA